MAAEDTAEHRDLFGTQPEMVAYFNTPRELVSVVTGLLEDDNRRAQLADSAHHLVVDGQHTYADRLRTMLTHAERSITFGRSE